MNQAADGMTTVIQTAQPTTVTPSSSTRTISQKQQDEQAHNINSPDTYQQQQNEAFRPASQSSSNNPTSTSTSRALITTHNIMLEAASQFDVIYEQLAQIDQKESYYHDCQISITSRFHIHEYHLVA